MCGIWPSTGALPSTRTIVPIPTGESSAVQKWNSCGVFGRRSVATTRPSDMCAVTKRGFSDRAESLLTVTNAVHHCVPPAIRQRQRGRFGQHPPGDLVGSLGRSVRRGDLDADETPQWIVARIVADPKIPRCHGRPLRGDAKHAGTLGAPEPEHHV